MLVSAHNDRCSQNGCDQLLPTAIYLHCASVQYRTDDCRREWETKSSLGHLWTMLLHQQNPMSMKTITEHSKKQVCFWPQVLQLDCLTLTVRQADRTAESRIDGATPRIHMEAHA